MSNQLLALLESLRNNPDVDQAHLRDATAYATLQDRCLVESTGKALEVFDLAAFAEECHANAVDHGWHDTYRTFGDAIALMHSELSEALEAYREPLPLATRMFNLKDLGGGPAKPDGILPELADVVIRILDYVGSVKATNQFLVSLKMKHAYNKSRPHRHGGKLL